MNRSSSNFLHLTQEKKTYGISITMSEHTHIPAYMHVHQHTDIHV